MAPAQELEVQQKRELEKKEEPTTPARIFLPNTDIYETEDALMVAMEMPGVENEHVDITLEDDVLSVVGRIDFVAIIEMPGVSKDAHGRVRRQCQRASASTSTGSART